MEQVLLHVHNMLSMRGLPSIHIPSDHLDDRGDAVPVEWEQNNVPARVPSAGGSTRGPYEHLWCVAVVGYIDSRQC